MYKRNLISTGVIFILASTTWMPNAIAAQTPDQPTPKETCSASDIAAELANPNTVLGTLNFN